MNPDLALNYPSDNFAGNVLLFMQCLRNAGLPVSTDQVMDFARALTLIKIGQRPHVYHAARCLLVSRHEDLRLFDAIFDAFWSQKLELGQHPPQIVPPAPRHNQPPVLVSYMASKAQPQDPELDVQDKSATYSDQERLSRKDFAQMTPDELNVVKHLIQAMRWKACFRRSRRRVASPAGDSLHMRRVMALAVRHGGVPLVLAWQRRKIKQRPLVLIADISGSMESYSRLVLQFFFSLSQSLKNVECFVFGTRLTRITLQLRLKNIDRAVSEAAGEVVDWAGGTRIGDSLLTFNHEWSRRVLHRGAIALIVSDGWERGDTDNLRKQMQYLQLRCYRLIWLNPLKDKGQYQPNVEGMAAALPFIDDFLPIHNLHNLTALAEHLAALSA